MAIVNRVYRKYRYQFPIAILFFKYGFRVDFQQPIVRKVMRGEVVKESELDISTWLRMLDDDP